MVIVVCCVGDASVDDDYESEAAVKLYFKVGAKCGNAKPITFV